MKIKIGSQNVLYPLPLCIVGTFWEGKINLSTVIHTGLINANSPFLISVSVNKKHLTRQVMRENKTFSVNLLAADQVVTADYVGLVSGREVDKASLFEWFFGELPGAPLIKNCPLSMECRVVDIYELSAYDVFIAEIAATYAEQAVLKDGAIDLAQVNPLLFDVNGKQYWSLGKAVGQGWSEGKKWQPVVPQTASGTLAEQED
jgi:flavin reductase (DIM6/NTAB) family NADH-FMN oxidoreductase RutF